MRNRSTRIIPTNVDEIFEAIANIFVLNGIIETEDELILLTNKISGLRGYQAHLMLWENDFDSTMIDIPKPVIGEGETIADAIFDLFNQLRY